MNRFKTRSEINLLSKEVSCKKISYTGLIVAILFAASSIATSLLPLATEDSSAAACNTNPCNVTFQVNVQDSLSVAITTPQSGATGNVNTFLRNTVNLSVDSNVSNGFTASMYSKDTTNLTHKDLSSTTIPTLSSSVTRSGFTSGRWGYSLKSASLNGNTYGETDAGNNSSRYYPLTSSTSSPITILSGAAGTKSGTQSIYFGAKASSSNASGIYSNTVVISVVTGTIDTSNPATPTDPAKPSTDTVANDNQGTYTGTGTTTGVGVSNSDGTTVATTTSSSGSGTSATNTTTTRISAGDNTRVSPQGVMSTSGLNSSKTESGLGTNNTLPVALAATAGAAATSGILFFILAKRHDDDEEEQA